MPNSLNAAKRYRQSQAARLRNRASRSVIRTKAKKFEAAVNANDSASAESLFAGFTKAIDTAVRKNLYHRNTAARKKSRLHRRLLSIAK